MNPGTREASISYDVLDVLLANALVEVKGWKLGLNFWFDAIFAQCDNPEAKCRDASFGLKDNIVMKMLLLKLSRISKKAAFLLRTKDFFPAPGVVVVWYHLSYKQQEGINNIKNA